jgi:hypothetical protein
MLVLSLTAASVNSECLDLFHRELQVVPRTKTRLSTFSYSNDADLVEDVYRLRANKVSSYNSLPVFCYAGLNSLRVQCLIRQ